MSKILLIVFVSFLIFSHIDFCNSKYLKQKQEILAQENNIKLALSETSNDQDLAKFAPLIFPDTVSAEDLIPSQKLYLDTVVNSAIQAENLRELESLSDLDIQKFEFNFQNQRVKMPYNDNFKIGDGFDIKNNIPKSSPFSRTSFIEEGPSIDTAANGEVSVFIATSAKELATALSIDAEAWGSGWQAEIKASFSYDSQETLQQNEVLLRASHLIYKGKALVEPSKFLLTEIAKRELAEDYQGFINSYGTHFIAGYTKGCSMLIDFKKKAENSESKTEIAAKLSASYKSLSFQAGLSVEVDYSKESKEFYESTDVSIKYKGAKDNNTLVKAFTVDSLNSAILNFSEECEGNILYYILWPYESLQSFSTVKNSVDILLKQKLIKSQQSKLENLKKELEDQKNSDKEIREQMEKDWEDFVKEQKVLKEAEEKAIQEKIAKSKEFKTILDILDDIFTEAILETRILRHSLEEQNPLEEQQEQKENDIWNLKKTELQLNYQYKIELEKLSDIQIESEVNLKKMLDYLDQVKKNVKKWLNQHKEIVDYECDDENCSKCPKYDLDKCLKCNLEFNLFEEKCIKACPIGYFSSETDNSKQCLPCHFSCKSCTEEANQCTSCKNKNILHDSQCIGACPQGYMVKNMKASRVCQKCSDYFDCKLYTENTCVCKACNKGLVMQNSKCVNKCSSHYFYDEVTKQCQECNIQCGECKDNSKNCISCPKGKYLQGSNCQSNCNNKFENINNVCKLCKTINHCVKYKTNKCECEKCSSAYALAKNQCVSCPAGQYVKDNACHKCTPNCLTCSGSSNRCTSCKSPAYQFETICQTKIAQQIPAYAAKWGKYVTCPSKGVLVGTCGSGKNADCKHTNGKKYHHIEMCSQQSYYHGGHQILNARWGTWRFCSTGAIYSLCRSGKNADCSGYHARLQCATRTPVNRKKCSYQQTKTFGAILRCPHNYVLVGICESGKNRDCIANGANSGKRQYVHGIYCCEQNNLFRKFEWLFSL